MAKELSRSFCSPLVAVSLKAASTTTKMVDCNFVRNSDEFDVFLHQAVGVLAFTGTPGFRIQGWVTQKLGRLEQPEQHIQIS